MEAHDTAATAGQRSVRRAQRDDQEIPEGRSSLILPAGGDLREVGRIREQTCRLAREPPAIAVAPTLPGQGLADGKGFEDHACTARPAGAEWTPGR